MYPSLHECARACASLYRIHPLRSAFATVDVFAHSLRVKALYDERAGEFGLAVNACDALLLRPAALEVQSQHEVDCLVAGSSAESMRRLPCSAVPVPSPPVDGR